MGCIVSVEERHFGWHAAYISSCISFNSLSDDVERQLTFGK